ncbi:MAG: T9SS type A sorting domain-containing protein [Candidatus Zixiibacteriota bacterium]
MRNKLAFIIIFFIATIFAQFDSESIDFVSQILSGACEVIETDGEFSYIGCGLSFIIADVSVPGFPDAISSTFMSSRIVDLMVLEDRVYLATWESGISIFDVSDPIRPRVMGEFIPDLDGLQIRKIDIQDDIVAICDIEHGIFLVDISISGAPELISIIEREESLYDIDIDGDFLYIANGGGLLIYDISSPSVPSYVTHLPVSRDTKVIKIQSPNAIIGSGSFAFTIDISRPSLPEIIDSLSCVSEVTSLSFMPSFEGAISTFGAGVRIVAIDSSGFITETGHYGGWERSWDVKISDDIVQVACGYNGLKFVDISTIGMPADLSELNISGSTRGIYLSDDNIFVSDIYNGVYVIDKTDPFLPVVSEHFNTIERAINLSEKDGFVYVANQSNLLPIIDTEEGEITEILFDSSSLIKDIKIRNRFAYIIIEARECEANALHILDISDPEAPYEISSVTTSSAAFEIELSGDYAFLAQKLEGIAIINISDPYEPYAVATYSNRSHSVDITAEGISIIGDTVYIADSYGKLDILILNTDDYSLMDEIYINELEIDYSYDVEVIDGFAFMACGDDGIRVFDTRDLSAISQIGFFEGASGGKARDIEIQDNFAYVSYGDNGIFILDISAILDSRAAIFAENKYKPDRKYLSVHPNPFNSRMNIKIENPRLQSIEQVDIYNLQGRKIQELPIKGDGNCLITQWQPEDHLSSGIYYVKAGNIEAIKVVYLK